MKRWAVMLALVPMVLFGAACGSDDDDDAESGSGSGSEATSDAPPVFTITAKESGEEFVFDIPDDVAGGVVTLQLVSDKANKESHDFQLAKLEDGHKVEELLAQLADDEAPLVDWIEDGTGVGSVAPGQTASATVELEPDTEYAFFCTESGEEVGPHSAHGMSGTFTTGDDSGAEMPDATATIVAKEYGFTIDGLKAGENTIAFTNEGAQLHHVLLIPFANNATFEDVKKAFASEEEPEGPPPVDFEKGVFSAVAGKGDTIVYSATLAAGKYVAICFMPDKGTAGPPHVAKGMIQEVEVS